MLKSPGHGHVTIAKAKGDELVEEMIIYDMSDMMRQLGLIPIREEWETIFPYN